ncbi:MAG: tyrosine--tRNA ligase [Candidatus Nealsonbacteria bacterium CG23_combo_of_CG06-09_8_20_14_all_40_13]|uniref:Tyrosine--tRNA ligase n=1 Tax=Candidatus Nealsonbacteria bacterium CG23_combo_of_CG06-09_8_20_14_all_40_13 TaxID=1974724 RepID=A0A2G9YRV3_9BACT|nr:MAG: tyrosine--tRNA ligase [Candidatus Nealsonbacteria bacterium CG23_combo_of_CG06-09_8_20_14_all_40_13]PIR71028.1 MAG: tyrosine--tRNA ligase [Candidatus Nealsonbacteria bacterium CG10_big_fil_rev_8_21_14_0_10_40_24]PIU43546.1 MAG: tyrosine--tRNA ligase [Candidatus Nealsonbacteria bacterium CG07_land_8_20_14_0_80_40_10]
MQQDELLTKSVAEIIAKENLEKKLASGKKLRIKYGIDPTTPEIHLGHAVPIRKLAQFQQLGHKIVFLLGDFTAQIGDPSGKLKTRTALSSKQVEENAKTFLAQVFQILDPDATEVHRQSEWFGKMNLADFFGILSKVSVNVILSHETFKNRLSKDLPLAMHELIYPVLQGYDSVAVKADVEVGGQDQKFNLLMGRHIQRAFGQNQQEIVMTKYLLGTDGKEKMSKSLGNFIALTDSPDQMYGKVMSIPDELIVPYFELCTNISVKGLQLIKNEYKNSQARRDLKAKLGKLIVETYHHVAAAEASEEEFNKIFKNKEKPSVIAEVKISSKQAILADLLVELKLADSRSEAKRLILQGAVKVADKILKDPFVKIELANGAIVQVGKRKFAKVIL